MAPRPPPKEQLLGSVLWHAAGDALGFLVEGRSAAECAAYTRELVRTEQVVSYGLLRNVPIDTPGYVPLATAAAADVFAAFGQVTDDTQLMRELLRSLADAHGVLNGGDVAQRIAQLFQDAGLLRLHPPLPNRGRGVVGSGRSTREAAQLIADGDAEAWHTSGRDSPGNGGCMRAGPLGVLYSDADDSTLATVAALQSHPTHARLETKAAAAALVVATRLAATTATATIDRAVFCSAVAKVAGIIHGTVAEALAVALPKSLELPPDEGRALIVEWGVRCRDDTWSNGDVISPCAVQAVCWAISSFLRHPDDPLECICAAIEGGGDADTTAAMAGSIAGARCGAACMPAWIRTRLTDRGGDGAEELASLVDELYVLMEADQIRPIGGLEGEGLAAAVPNLFRAPDEVAAEAAAAVAAAAVAVGQQPEDGVETSRLPKRLFDEM